MPQAIRRGWRSVPLLLLLSVQPLVAAVPDWVKQLQAQPSMKFPPETNAVVLLDDEQIVVTAPGDYVERYRRVVKILRPEGRSEAKLRIYLDGKREKLISARAWSIDSAGHEYELKDKDFTEGSHYTFELYSELRFRSADAPAAQPGSIIAFEHEVKRHDWWNELRWDFQEDIPVRLATFTAEVPSGWEIKTFWASATPVDPVAVSDHRWTWTMRDVPAIQDEPLMPSRRALHGRMSVAYFAPGQPNTGSWNDFALGYIEMIKGRRDPSPEISDKTRQIVGTHTDFDGKIRALGSFVQSDVRYVAIEIGIGGYQPHPATQIFRARYGDCKDKATLLSTMLKEAGINSYYVIIDTRRGAVDPNMPGPWFDHAILAIELPADAKPDQYPSFVKAKDSKRYLIFDPTDEYMPLGQLRGELQNTYAVLVTDSGGELIQTPLLAPESNTLSRTGRFTLDPSGTISGEVLETRTGDFASRERAYLVHANQTERTQRAERHLNGSLKGFTLQSLDVRQLNDLNQNLELAYRFTASDYGQLHGPLMLVRPRILGEKNLALDPKPRKYPIEFEGPSRQTDSFEIQIPEGFVVDDVPEPTKVDVGFARYQSHFEVTGNKVRYSREYEIRDVHVSPEKISDFRNLQGKIGADEFSAVVLKHP